MKCQNCGQERATVHITAYPQDKDKKAESHLCRACAAKLDPPTGATGSKPESEGGNEEQEARELVEETTENMLQEFTESDIVYSESAESGETEGRLRVDLASLEELARSMPIVKLLNLILLQAIKDKSSDIHFETDEDEFRVRYRVDGVLYEMMPPPKHLAKPIISRIKVMAGLDITEHRRPQTGRVELRVSEQPIDLIVSTAPCIDGERCVIRIMDPTVVPTQLIDIGLGEEGLLTIRRWQRKANGLVLVTGPSGSGKTTTLHAMVNELNGPERAIIGIEDPLTSRIGYVGHLVLRPGVGFGYPEAIRTAMLQACDLLYVSELPDTESAESACRAASSGCLVLGSLCADSVAAAAAQLLHMGCQPHLIASTLVGITNQRLVRRVCAECSEKHSIDELSSAERSLIEDTEIGEFCQGKGCANCNNTGYRGRAAIYEVVEVSDDIRDAIVRQAPTHEMREAVAKSESKALLADGLAKVAAGITMVSEVLRVI